MGKRACLEHGVALVVEGDPAARPVGRLLTVLEVGVDDNGKLDLARDLLLLEIAELANLDEDDIFGLGSGFPASDYRTSFSGPTSKM